MKSVAHAKLGNSKVRTVPSHLTVKFLAKILQISERSIQKRAVRDEWSGRSTATRGGRRLEFLVDSLPDDIKRKIYIHYGIIPENLEDCIPSDFDPDRIARCAEDWDRAREWQRTKARARKTIIDAWLAYREKQKCGARKAAEQFCELYRDQAAPGLDPDIYVLVRKISRSTLHTWFIDYQRDGIAGLISRHGHNRGQTLISLDQQEFIFGTVANHPRWGSYRIATALTARFGDDAAGRAAISRFIEARKAADPSTYCYLVSPDTSIRTSIDLLSAMLR